MHVQFLIVLYTCADQLPGLVKVIICFVVSALLAAMGALIKGTMVN